MFIFPYKAGSASAKVLSAELTAKRIKLEGSAFKGSPKKTVINWGASAVSDEVAKCNIINPPEAVALASNKLKFFEKVDDSNDNIYEEDEDFDDIVNFPSFTTSKRTAARWLNSGKVVVERHKLTGNSGEGIRLVENEDDLQTAPLYVQYVPKKQEYRVHVANGMVVDLQRKARRRDVADEDINWRIRNHDNGFIFQRNDLVVPPQVERQAVNACKAVGLDFGAVDIVFNDHQQKAFVLEINTAPGLTGSTLEGYVKRFKDWYAVAPVVRHPEYVAEARPEIGRPLFHLDDLARAQEAMANAPAARREIMDDEF